MFSMVVSAPVTINIILLVVLFEEQLHKAKRSRPAGVLYFPIALTPQRRSDEASTLGDIDQTALNSKLKLS